MVVSQMSSDVTIKSVSSRLGAATQKMIVVIGLMKVAVPQIHQVLHAVIMSSSVDQEGSVSHDHSTVTWRSTA